MSSKDDFLNALSSGDIRALDELSETVSGLPWSDAETGRRVLIAAIESSKEESVRWVLARKPEINFVDECGFTPLKHVLQIESECDPTDACQAPRTQVTLRLIDLLIEAGADIKFQSSLGESILHTAAVWSSPAVISHLLNLGADPMLFDDEYIPRQPIYYAKRFGRWAAQAVLENAMNAHKATR